MDDLRTLLDNLRDNRLDYVMARSRCNSDSEALRQSGISKSVFYGRPEEERKMLMDIAQRVKREAATRALMVIQDAAEEAAKVKVGALKLRDERIKQAAATEILDRNLGKPTQRAEVDAKTDSTLKIIVEYADGQTDATQTTFESD